MVGCEVRQPTHLSHEPLSMPMQPCAAILHNDKLELQPGETSPMMPLSPLPPKLDEGRSLRCRANAVSSPRRKPHVRVDRALPLRPRDEEDDDEVVVRYARAGVTGQARSVMILKSPPPPLAYSQQNASPAHPAGNQSRSAIMAYKRAGENPEDGKAQTSSEQSGWTFCLGELFSLCSSSSNETGVKREGK
ncbi:MAG: hypothetical protein LQ340_000008 [Diploschistes diacapsis]|nr:MAG: hypothetical protein LQ340_000008 [Diploschistes diacapsis]